MATPTGDPVQLSWASVLAWRMARQGLARRAPAADWMDVARRICGLHAQVQSAAELTLWARVDELDPGAVARALWTDRALVRTWAMRGTLHLLPADELATWVGAQGLLRPRYETAAWRRAFGMTSAEAVAVLDAIRTALDGEPLTRDELGDAVAAALGDEVAAVSVAGTDGWMLAADVADASAAAPGGHVALLPAFDRYVVAAPLEDTPVLAAAQRSRVYRAQGWLSPVLLVDGRIEGVWKHERKAGTLTVTIEPFGDPGEEVRAAAAAEAQRLLAYFADEELDLSWAA